MLFQVQASIAPELDAAFNRWYDEVHCPEMLRKTGVLTARRYRQIMGEAGFEYVAVYEFSGRSEFERFLVEDLPGLSDEYERRWGASSLRRRTAFELISDIRVD